MRAVCAADAAIIERVSPEELRARDGERVKVEAFVKVSGAEREYVLRTRDLSRSGLFLYTRVAHIYPFKVGSRLQIELYDYDEFMTCKVVVVRVVEPGSAEADRYPTGFGVRIVEIDEQSRIRMDRLIERVATTGQEPY
jgi:PilZ domain-containing protein